MVKTFKVGDRVSWNSEAGRVRGRIVKIHRRNVNYKGYVHHASRDEPQYEIKSDKTDHVALHKAAALRHLKLTTERQYEPALAMTFPFFTIGHSTRPIGEFIDLLAASQIGLVVDVRTVPRSRTNPQYNRETLPVSLSNCRIAYEHIAELGGLRPRAHDIAPSVNGFWENQSFHNYADYAMGAGFQFGFTRLRESGSVRRCAVMCAEAVWWRCHRRIITDYLLIAGERVFHILGPKAITPASLTKGAKSQSGGVLTYPAF